MKKNAKMFCRWKQGRSTDYETGCRKRVNIELYDYSGKERIRIFCPYCGKPIKEKSEVKNEKENT
jgi:hypothetical protein